MKRYVVNIILPLFFLLVVGFIGYSKFVNAPPAPPPPAADNRPVKRILFIGNSHTYTNDMPMMIPLIAASVPGEAFRYETSMIVVGGRELIEHAGQQDVVNKIHAGGNDYVILQEQSMSPLLTEGAINSMTAFEFLSKLAKGAKAEPVIYGTWARKAGNAFYSAPVASNLKPPRSPQEMIRRMDEFYQKVAAKTGARYLPVGRYWWNTTQQYPAIELYNPDGYHPSVQGSYLTALVFYRYFSRNDPMKVTWAPPGVSPEEAQALRAVAAR